MIERMLKEFYSYIIVFDLTTLHVNTMSSCGRSNEKKIANNKDMYLFDKQSLGRDLY